MSQVLAFNISFCTVRYNGINFTMVHVSCFVLQLDYLESVNLNMLNNACW